MSRVHRWRRGDGTVLSCTDLAEAVPMMLDELDDIKRLLSTIEEWLRYDEGASDLLTDWLWAVNCDPDLDPRALDVIGELGALSVKLLNILKAGIPHTGHIHHPPTA